MTSAQLGIEVSDNEFEAHMNSGVALEKIDAADPILQTSMKLLEDGFAGIIFTGSPGTGKSRYARLIAEYLTGFDPNKTFYVQFHPGYQYEDFIESYVPNINGGFELRPKVFLKACEAAVKSASTPVVLVIDELSRTDVIRVFGEALTYLEQPKRGVSFYLASNIEVFIPKNLIVIATMNPWDRGVDELDLALERRFAKIKIDPSLESLRKILEHSSISDARKLKVEQFFQMVSNHKNPLCRIGHAYFQTAKSDEALARLWTNQLVFHFERVLKTDTEEFSSVQTSWARIFED